MKPISSDKRLRRAVLDASLLCAALLLSYVEAVIPSFALPVPGFKAGLANIAVLFACFSLSCADSAVIAFTRCIMSFLFFGSPTSLIFSLSGAALVQTGLLLIRRTGLTKHFSFWGISVLSALLHNSGQLIAACALVGPAVFGYIPALMLASLIYGSVTGAVLSLIPDRIYKICSKFPESQG